MITRLDCLDGHDDINMKQFLRETLTNCCWPQREAFSQVVRKYFHSSPALLSNSAVDEWNKLKAEIVKWTNSEYGEHKGIQETVRLKDVTRWGPVSVLLLPQMHEGNHRHPNDNDWVCGKVLLVYYESSITWCFVDDLLPLPCFARRIWRFRSISMSVAEVLRPSEPSEQPSGVDDVTWIKRKVITK